MGAKAERAKSYRRQQKQLYKANKHAAKADYAATMRASKAGVLSGRQLRSKAHYEHKEARQARRSQKHLAKAERAKSYRRQQKQLYKANKHAAKADYAATMSASKAGVLSGRQ